MRKMLAVILILVFIGSGLIALCGCEPKLELLKRENVVKVGLETPITIIHTTDTHLTRCSDSDSKDTQKTAKRRSKRFEYTQEMKLEYVGNLSKENGFMILHTGDIMDFVTDANIEYAKNWVQNNDCYYVNGNHETDGASAETLEKLASIQGEYAGNCYSIERNGIVFVGIDNSQHKMSTEQLEYLKNVVDKGMPIVLFMHVPLYSRELYDAAMDDGDSAYLMAVPEELMKDYPQNRYDSQLADKATFEAYDYIIAQKNIIAIIAGHLHFDFETKVGDIPEFVTDLDSIRIIRFE